MHHLLLCQMFHCNSQCKLEQCVLIFNYPYTGSYFLYSIYSILDEIKCLYLCLFFVRLRLEVQTSKLISSKQLV
uniref:Uncharacterized protein n=1 Tax=Aegilops tauschii subsp. strangulata TaxID=200361 RepID=A0A453NIE2_AEGTS